MQQRQREQRADEAVAGLDLGAPFLVGLDLDRAALHADGVAADGVRGRERRGRRRKEGEVTGGLVDERGELAEHGRRIARHLVVLHDLDLAAATDDLDDDVADEPARRGERGSEARQVLALAVGERALALPRVDDGTRVADHLRHAHIGVGNQAEPDRLEGQP